MLKYTVINNTVANITIPLYNDIDYINNIDYSDPINNIESEVIDNEIKKYILSGNINLTFEFFKNNLYNSTFINAGFEEEEITLSNRNYRFSYILMQVFDSIDFKSQNLLHSSYIPIYLFPEKISTFFDIKPLVKYYEFNNIYLSNNLSLNNNQILYSNFKFYNAKTGKLLILFNKSVTTNGQEKFYFPITLNKTNSTYTFSNSTIIAREFINEEYLNKINQLDKSENKSPIYPIGTKFDIEGNYS
jgi:hypothetical protein